MLLFACQLSPDQTRPDQNTPTRGHARATHYVVVVVRYVQRTVTGVQSPVYT